MPESEAHKNMKPHAATFLRDELGCGYTTTEPVIAKGWGLACRPDVLGVCTHHPDSKRLWFTHDVEVEPDLRGIAAEYQKPHRKNPFRSLTDYQWLMHPDDIEPDCDTLRIPTHVGLVAVSGGGVAKVYREARNTKAGHRGVVALLASQLLHYQRETGRKPDSVRPAAKAHAITREKVVEAVRFVASYADQDFPEVSTGLVARHLNVKHNKLLRAIKDGLLPELEHDPNMKTLVVKELKASA